MVEQQLPITHQFPRQTAFKEQLQRTLDNVLQNNNFNEFQQVQRMTCSVEQIQAIIEVATAQSNPKGYFIMLDFARTCCQNIVIGARFAKSVCSAIQLFQQNLLNYHKVSREGDAESIYSQYQRGIQSAQLKLLCILVLRGLNKNEQIQYVEQLLLMAQQAPSASFDEQFYLTFVYELFHLLVKEMNLEYCATISFSIVNTAYTKVVEAIQQNYIPTEMWFRVFEAGFCNTMYKYNDSRSWPIPCSKVVDLIKSDFSLVDKLLLVWQSQVQSSQAVYELLFQFSKASRLRHETTGHAWMHYFCVKLLELTNTEGNEAYLIESFLSDAGDYLLQVFQANNQLEKLLQWLASAFFKAINARETELFKVLAESISGLIQRVYMACAIQDGRQNNNMNEEQDINQETRAISMGFCSSFLENIVAVPGEFYCSELRAAIQSAFQFVASSYPQWVTDFLTELLSKNGQNLTLEQIVAFISSSTIDSSPRQFMSLIQLVSLRIITESKSLAYMSQSLENISFAIDSSEKLFQIQESNEEFTQLCRNLIHSTVTRLQELQMPVMVYERSVPSEDEYALLYCIQESLARIVSSCPVLQLDAESVLFVLQNNTFCYSQLFKLAVHRFLQAANLEEIQQALTTLPCAPQMWLVFLQARRASNGRVSEIPAKILAAPAFISLMNQYAAEFVPADVVQQLSLLMQLSQECSIPTEVKGVLRESLRYINNVIIENILNYAPEQLRFVSRCYAMILDSLLPWIAGQGCYSWADEEIDSDAVEIISRTIHFFLLTRDEELEQYSLKLITQLIQDKRSPQNEALLPLLDWDVMGKVVLAGLQSQKMIMQHTVNILKAMYFSGLNIPQVNECFVNIVLNVIETPVHEWNDSQAYHAILDVLSLMDAEPIILEAMQRATKQWLNLDVTKEQILELLDKQNVQRFSADLEDHRRGILILDMIRYFIVALSEI